MTMKCRVKAFVIDPISVVDLLSGRTRCVRGIPSDEELELEPVIGELNT